MVAVDNVDVHVSKVDKYIYIYRQWPSETDVWMSIKRL